MVRYILNYKWILTCILLPILVCAACAIKSKDDTTTNNISKAAFYRTLNVHEPYREYRPLENVGLNVVYSPDGNYLIVAGRMGILRYETQTYQEPFTLTTKDKNIGSVAFSPDGKTFAYANGQNIQLWNTLTWEKQKTLTTPTWEKQKKTYKRELYVKSIVFNPNGKTLASLSELRNIYGFYIIDLWDAKTGKHKRSITECEPYRSIPSRLRNSIFGFGKLSADLCRFRIPFSVFDLTFSSNGKILAISGGHNIFLCNNKSGIYKQKIDTKQRFAYRIAFSPDNKMLAVGGTDKTIQLWNPKKVEHKRSLNGHDNTVYDIVFSPIGQILASADLDGIIRLWDTKTDEHKQTLTGHTNGVNSVAFCPNGTMLASAGWDGKVLLWNLNVDK